MDIQRCKIEVTFPFFCGKDVSNFSKQIIRIVNKDSYAGGPVADRNNLYELFFSFLSLKERNEALKRLKQSRLVEHLQMHTQPISVGTTGIQSRLFDRKR